MNQLNQPPKFCTRCETLPNKSDGRGQLYLWLPSEPTFHKVQTFLKKTDFDYQLVESEKCLRILLIDKPLDQLSESLLERLTPKELNETNALWMSEFREPQLRDFSQVISLNNLFSLHQGNWLLELLREERFTSYFQPIVYADNPCQVFAQEALLRGLDEQHNIIPPYRIFSQATNAGLLFQVDRLARLSAIKQAQKHNIQDLIFINFSPTSVYDPATCLRTTVRAIDAAEIPHDRVVFEVMETDQPPEIEHLSKILKYYQEAGFLIALDDFGTGYSNLNRISQLRPNFIKLDRHLVKNVHEDPYTGLITEKILEITQTLGIKTIAEGIECQEEFDWVRQRGATFMQGYFIAKPSAIPVTTHSLKEQNCPSILT